MKKKGSILMGCKRDFRLIICIIMYFFCALASLPKVRASENETRASLNNFVYDYAFKNRFRPRTGRVYNVSLPTNFSGVEVSVLRIRTRSLWRHGANLGYFEIPSRTLPRPFARRIDIVYQNLGNWSSFYYSVSNYTFLTPVVGLLAYDSSSSLMNRGLIELDLRGENPIIVRFPDITSLHNETLRCVRFDSNGTLEFSNVTGESSCLAQSLGHFSIVFPYHEPEEEKKKKTVRWWVVGFAGGVVGLILLVVLGIVAFKLIKGCRMRRMVSESERSEGLDSSWVGRSRMPSASSIRTQPVLENSYVP